MEVAGCVVRGGKLWIAAPASVKLGDPDRKRGPGTELVGDFPEVIRQGHLLGFLISRARRGIACHPAVEADEVGPLLVLEPIVNHRPIFGFGTIKGIVRATELS